MSTIDRQRVAAVRYSCRSAAAAREWTAHANDATPLSITDALHSLLIARADELVGCTEGSDEERELAAITDAIDAYEAVRWPGGKVAGGKG